ncbi:hypothetical protein FRC09_005082 [Ceratobasidium sp. 395]|nr:hypothetical protein FRC09_005082 [Ceratobasidium sp. 395]
MAPATDAQALSVGAASLLALGQVPASVAQSCSASSAPGSAYTHETQPWDSESPPPANRLLDYMSAPRAPAPKSLDASVFLARSSPYNLHSRQPPLSTAAMGVFSLAPAAPPHQSTLPAAQRYLVDLRTGKLVLDLTTPTPKPSHLPSGAVDLVSPPPSAKGKQTDPQECQVAKLAAKKAKATPSPKKSPAKQPRTSSKVEAAAAVLSAEDKADLDVPPIEMSDVGSDVGADFPAEQASGSTSLAKTGHRFSDLQRTLILTHQYEPEKYRYHREHQKESIKELWKLLKGELSEKQIRDFLSAANTRYLTYTRIALKMGSGKDDKLTREEMEKQHHRQGAQFSADFWWRYGESSEYQIINEARWDDEEVQKHKNVDSVTAISPNAMDVNKKVPAEGEAGSSKDKGKGKSHKRAREDSNSNEDDHLAIGIMQGLDRLGAACDWQLTLMEKQHDFNRQAQEARTTREDRAALISDLIALGQAAPGLSARVQGYAGRLLDRVGQQLDAPTRAEAGRAGDAGVALPPPPPPPPHPAPANSADEQTNEESLAAAGAPVLAEVSTNHSGLADVLNVAGPSSGA